MSSKKIARRTISGDGYRVINKDTHFIITLEGHKVRVKQTTNEVARTAHACADIRYFRQVWDDTMAQDAKNKQAAERQLANLKKVEDAAKADIPIEQRMIRAPKGMKRVVWVMPRWKRALRWIKRLIMGDQVEVPLPSMCGRCGKNPIDPTATIDSRPAVLCKQCFSDLLDPRKPFDLLPGKFDPGQPTANLTPALSRVERENDVACGVPVVERENAEARS